MSAPHFHDPVDGEGLAMDGQLRESDGESSDSEVSSVAESLRDPAFDCMGPLQHLALLSHNHLPLGARRARCLQSRLRHFKNLQKIHWGLLRMPNANYSFGVSGRRS